MKGCYPFLENLLPIKRFRESHITRPGWPFFSRRKQRRIQKNFFIPSISLLMLLLMAGGCVQGKNQAAPSTSTPSGLQTTATMTSDTVLYFENFEDSSRLSEWDTKTQDEASAAIAQEGAYHLRVDHSDLAAILRGRDFTDTIITIDLEFLGPEPATASIICRNAEGGYTFSIASSGHWQIDSFHGKLPGGDTRALQGGVKMTTPE
jgi:hypothetical protein